MSSAGGRPHHSIEEYLGLERISNTRHEYLDGNRPEMDRDDRHAVVNPIVLVEVTSSSSAGYDRGAKLDHYQQIDALREVVLIAHDARRVDVWRRQEDGGWLSDAYVDAAALVRLASLGCELQLSEIYRNPLPVD